MFINRVFSRNSTNPISQNSDSSNKRTLNSHKNNCIPHSSDNYNSYTNRKNNLPQTELSVFDRRFRQDIFSIEGQPAYVFIANQRFSNVAVYFRRHIYSGSLVGAGFEPFIEKVCRPRESAADHLPRTWSAMCIVWEHVLHLFRLFDRGCGRFRFRMPLGWSHRVRTSVIE